MLLLGSKLLNYPVLSLQIGGELGITATPIIDPVKLKIIAYQLSGPLVDREPANTLMTDDVRELSPMGLIIDSVDDLVDPNDVIRVKQIIDYDFHLINHKVITKKKQNIGRVADYTIDSATFSIYQLVVKRPFLSSLNDPELTINRSQIIEIDDDKVIIKNDTQTVKLDPVQLASSSSYINPFRKTETPKPVESSDTE
ncbi:PRC-barrel domain-containing protein [Candidatus Saccharibacteria bacterium]|nr:PRC-barrel domain-containing protein [Candidatus Saccharibacteria bacterium]